MTEPLEMPAGEHRDLEVEIDAQIARGLYSNVVLVSCSRTEITLDFAYAQPDNRVIVQARIILAPDNARELIGLLSAQLEMPTALPPPSRNGLASR